MTLDEELIEAAQQGDSKRLQKCLAKGANPRALNDRALSTTLAPFNLKCVEELIIAGNYEETNPSLALLAHASLGNTKKVERLLLQGVPVDPKEGSSALAQACAYGRISTIKSLLEAGANIEHQDGEPLTWAIEAKHSPTVKLLLEHHADLDINDSVQQAIDSEDVEIVDILIQGGADFRKDNHKLLRNAIEAEDIPLIQTLIKWDNYPKILPGIALRAYSLLSDNDKIQEIVERSHEEIKPHNKKYALETCADKANKTGIEHLCKRFQYTKEEYTNALTSASWNDDGFDTVELLLSKGATAQSEENQALLLAFSNKAERVAKRLLQTYSNAELQNLLQEQTTEERTTSIEWINQTIQTRNNKAVQKIRKQEPSLEI